ncbi:MAG: Ribonucleoside-diphosphate reductase NrdZ [Bacteroidetes bacterium ADurb.Bin408]|nr:MAG: Ribonucleoside-diphosphate reductase NrdZ [Bacteroidetes bacterium ADurb.Bin408]
MANDVNWVSKVKMQGQVQKWVDHSISVTVNVPNDATEELVANIYKTAWESGCKGVTVYREGSRDGVLISAKKETKKCNFKENSAPPRPKSLKAEIVRFNNNKEKWIAVVGILDDRPYEIFTGLASDISIPENITATIVKNRDKKGNSRYDITWVDHEGYEGSLQGLNRTFNEDYWNYAKLISGVLRHGMPLPSVVNMVSALKLNDETMNTWKNGVERALKKFIPDGTKENKNVCGNCGSHTLVYQEGCLICKDCGFSKCG